MEFRVTSKHKLTYLDAECNTLFECRFINVLENRYNYNEDNAAGDMPILL